MPDHAPYGAARPRRFAGAVLSALAATTLIVTPLVHCEAMAAASPQAPSQILTVNATNDVDDGACDATHCSLAEAIHYAGAGDLIIFSALFNTPQVIVTSSTFYPFVHDVTLIGPGSGLLEVQGTWLNVNAGVIYISGMKITNSIYGSAVIASGNGTVVSLSDVIVSDNYSYSNVHPVENSGGSVMHINNSVIRSNFNYAYGGGVYNNAATMTISNTLIDGNTAGFNGGGIANFQGTLTITNSTITNNTASSDSNGGGGGIYSQDNTTGASVTLINTTIARNSAPSLSPPGGSAISVNAPSTRTSTLTMTNCTVVDNSGDATAAVVSYAYAGGTAKVFLKNTIVDNSLLPNLAIGGDGDARITSNGNNLSNDSGSPFLRVTPPADIISTDPKLSRIGYFGGRTPTYLPMPGSPALDAGSNLGAPATDQRGVTRPVNGIVDIGAVEFHPLTVNSTADPGDGTCDASCALRDAIIAANANPADIVFSMPLFASPQTINLASELPHISGGMSIHGPGANLLTVRRNAGGDYSVISIGAGGGLGWYGTTLANGKSNFGAGVNNAGTLVLGGMTIDGNDSTYSGGGILNKGGVLTIDDSTISNNIAEDGGALYNSPGVANLTNTTLSGNTTHLHFTGGISNFSFGTDTTFVSLHNSTLANNVGGFGDEGGIYTAGIAATELKNTIVAGNTPQNLTGSVPNSFVSFGHNLSDDTAGGYLNAAGDLASHAALLAPLADNGGPTKTHALLSGSPAANAGNNFGAPPLDQRGVARIGTVDIGAFESDVLFWSGFEAP